VSNDLVCCIGNLYNEYWSSTLYW